MFSRLVFWNSVVTLRQMYTTQKSISDHMCEFVHMYEKEEENRLVLNPPLFCHTAWHLFIQLDLIISGNSQLTMCEISTQCMTIDESWHVKQLQMITDNIIASEYVPQHLIYSQNTSSSEPLWIHRPAAELCSKLHPYVTCLTLSLQNHRLILSFLSSSLHSLQPVWTSSFWPLRCRAVGLLMVWSICHGLEVANLTCSLGLALL